MIWNEFSSGIKIYGRFFSWLEIYAVLVNGIEIERSHLEYKGEKIR